MRLSGGQRPTIQRSNSLGTQLLRRGTPSRSAPESPDGSGLRASHELYAPKSDKSSVQISKKITVSEAVLLCDLEEKDVYQVWGVGDIEGSEVWREESAPKDESLFISMSASVVTPSSASRDPPTPYMIAKHVVNKVLREGWLPATEWDMDESDFPPFPFDLLEDPAYISDLCHGVTEVLEKEPHVVRVEGHVRVFGDIHGQFLDLLQFFRRYGSPDELTGLGGEVKHLFLGDFVDRGFYSLEVIVLLFSLKLLAPDRIILVRGNHESRSMSYQFGFREEVLSKFGPSLGPSFLEVFNNVFDHLPLSAVIGGRILCMHGGLGPNVETVDQILDVPKPLRSALALDEDLTWQNRVARDVLWSDPGQSCEKGFMDHPVRGSGVFRIGADMVEKFLKRNELQLILRGHECVSLGFAFNCLGRVMTIFSAINYCGDAGNAGAILDVSSDLVCQPKIIRHRPDARRERLLVKGENRLRESIHEELDVSMGLSAPTRVNVALYEFQKEKELELSLTAGEELVILDSSNPEWLWVQNAKGEQGYCPRSFVGWA